MTTEEAIRVIQNERECVHRQRGQGCDHKCATCDLVLQDKVVMNAYEMAIAALRTQQEAKKNEPLTVDELREINDGETVWVCYPQHISSESEGIWCSRCKFDFQNYGKTWMAYRHKPKDVSGLKCKIKWTEIRCRYESEVGGEVCGDQRKCALARKVQRGFDGDIQEYSIEKGEMRQNECITIIVNKRRKIELFVDLCGDADYCYCPCDYQVVTTFEIDGKPVEGYEGEEEPND